MKQVHYVVVLVVRRCRERFELLMGRRAEGIYMGGTWQLITGGLEPEETAWQAALRELHEETGLVPAELYVLSTLTSFYRDDNDSLYTAPMFCAMVAEGCTVKINAEHTHFEWVDVNEAAVRLMWPGDRTALDEVRSEILGDGLAKKYMQICLPST